MSSISLERDILRYKIIYSTVALILGISAMIGGFWLGSLEYQPNVTGWLGSIFGCAILLNENNIAPSFFFLLAGLLVIILTQYRIKTNRKPKRNIDGQVLIYKFIYSMVGLAVGFFILLSGIVLAEIGGNLCAPDWATKIANDDIRDLFYAGVIFFLAGIIVVIATRYRIRIYNNLEEE
ncbi:MAG: hypothetical protein J0M11_04415 [Anaerolineae bacterium]|nr:hypothetical protein [Anaerolineae bacterium]